MSLGVEELNQTNCKSYLVWSGSQAVLVDPVRERFETYRTEVNSRGLAVKYILETHMHADHVMFDRDAISALGAEVVMHERSPSPLVTRHVKDGDVIELGEQVIRVLHTPGHTPDSVCYAADGFVFTGDTLLIGGSGRTDFPGGDAGTQYDAVHSKLFSLPGETIVYPAHDYRGQGASTVAREKQENARFAGKSREQYIELMAELNLPLPDGIQEALQVNQSGFHAGEVLFPTVAEMAEVENLSATELDSRLQAAEPPLLLDVREPEEFVGELGHIQGALLVPLDALATRLPKLLGYSERAVVVVCRAGARSATACAILRRAGFENVFNLAEGMLAWVQAGFDVQR